MFEIRKEAVSDQIVLLRLLGIFTVESAADLHRVLLQELQGNNELQIDCCQVQSIDFYCLQLFCSAHRTAVSQNKHLSFIGRPAEGLIEAITQTGFLREHGCALCPDNLSCMWSGHINSSDA